MTPQVRMVVEVGDVLTMPGDVLILKHAQDLYGADRAAFESFQRIGIDLTSALPGPSSYFLTKSQGAVGAETVLFVGTPPLAHFSYEQIREFGYRALGTLGRAAPQTREVLITIHGPGYGLDETEAFESEVAGLLDALKLHDAPALDRITFVERNEGRARRLKASLERLFPQGTIQARGAVPLLSSSAAESLRTAGSEKKPFIFVAMPFDDVELDNRFEYGIRGAAHKAGFLCERADTNSFTGDVMARVKAKIEAASLVIAELSSANPNVYLEVGYAWGCGKPTVLVVCDKSDLKFDVSGQRCLIYGKSIKRLEEMLREELENLRAGI